MRLVSPSQPGRRRRCEALGPGRGRPRSQGDEPGREEKREKPAGNERRRISSELRFRVRSFKKNSSFGGKTQPTQEQPSPPPNTLSIPPPTQRTLLSSPLALPLDRRPHVTPRPLPIGQARGGRGTPSLGRSLQRGAFVAPPTASPQTAWLMATVLGRRRSV